MKKHFFLSLTLLFFAISFSQNVFPTSANTSVGIGTVTPTTRLEVTSGTADDSGVKLTNLTNASTPAAANGRALSVDTEGKVILVPTASATTPTLYTDNGTLLGDRIVSLAGKNLSFNPTNNASFNINGENGNVSIGIAKPEAKLFVSGNAIFSTNLPDGSVFTNSLDRDYKSLVLALGKAPSMGSSYVNAKMFNFYDYPQSNINAKSIVFFGIQDRWNATRFRMWAETSGVANFEMLDKYKSNVFTVVDDGNDKVTLTLPKINSKVGIGTATPTASLEVASGAAGDSGVKLTNLTSTSTPAAANGRALSVDTAGKVILVPTTSATTPTLYTDNGTLLGDRIVSMEGKNLSFNPTNNASFNINGANGNLGIGTTANKAKLEIEGFPAINTTYTFLDYGDSFAKSCILNIGTLRENENPSTSPGARLLTFSDVPPSNITASSQTMLAIDDRNNANRLRHHALANGFSSFTLSDKTQSNVFSVYEDGSNAFFDLTKTGSYLTVGGKAVWPVEHNFWVKTGTSKFNNDVFIDTHVGIGTSKFLDITDNKDYKLSVKGRIRAEEVKVYNTWADYVFKKEYNLRSLNDLEAYIDAIGHLPNVPSAKEVTEKGLELGEMTKIQQEKIEELTLYLIQQNKEIQELKAQMKALMSKK